MPHAQAPSAPSQQPRRLRAWALVLALIAPGLEAAPSVPPKPSAPPPAPAPAPAPSGGLAEQLREAVRLTEAQPGRRGQGVTQRFALVHPSTPQHSRAGPQLTRLAPPAPPTPPATPVRTPKTTADTPPGAPATSAMHRPTPTRPTEGQARPANRAGMEVGPQHPAIGALQRPRHTTAAAAFPNP